MWWPRDKCVYSPSLLFPFLWLKSSADPGEVCGTEQKSQDQEIFSIRVSFVTVAVKSLRVRHKKTNISQRHNSEDYNSRSTGRGKYNVWVVGLFCRPNRQAYMGKGLFSFVFCMICSLCIFTSIYLVTDSCSAE